MSYNLLTLTNEIAGAIHGTTTDKITNLYGIYNRTARQLVLDLDLMETKRIVSLGQVFNSIYNYSAPSDLKGNRIIDLRPQANRKGETWPQMFNQWFDKNKWLGNQNQSTVQFNTGIKSLRIDAPFFTAPVVFANFSGTSGVSLSGTASSLSIDTQFQVAGTGALQFNVAVGTGGFNTVSLPITDLSKHVGIAQEFFFVKLPSIPTSMNLFWGSDLSNGYSFSPTTQADGTAFQVGWNLIGIPWAGLTATGSPVTTAFKALNFTITAPTNMVGVEFCYMTSILGTILECEYYSKFLFRNPTTNAFQETVADAPTDNQTIINLDTESYNLFFNLAMYFIAQQLQGGDAKADGTYFKNEYDMGVKRYKGLYPSEVQFTQEPYYTITKGNYDGFVPRISNP